MSRLRRIKNELVKVQQNTQEPLLSFSESNDQCDEYNFTFSMNNISSPFVGANFNVKVSFPTGYPQSAPVLIFKNQIPYHFIIDQINGKVVGLDKLSTWSIHYSILTIFTDLYEKLIKLPSDDETCNANEDMLAEYRNTPHVYIEKARNSVKKLNKTQLDETNNHQLLTTTTPIEQKVDACEEENSIQDQNVVNTYNAPNSIGKVESITHVADSFIACKLYREFVLDGISYVQVLPSQSVLEPSSIMDMSGCSRKEMVNSCVNGPVSSVSTSDFEIGSESDSNNMGGGYYLTEKTDEESYFDQVHQFGYYFP